MKNVFSKLGRCSLGVAFLLLWGSACTLVSCKEDISDDAYAIAQKKTILDYLSDKPELSSIKQIFSEVKLGISDNASVLSSALSARGNYTVFAPNNEAIAAFVKEATNGESSDLSALTDEQKKAIALNCVIDNGDNSAYELADFPNNGMFAVTNLRDRRVSCKQDAEGDYILNDESKVVETNLEASNGMLHVIDHVMVPSDNSIAELLAQAPNMRVMSKLLELTGYDEKLSLKTQEEEAFEKENVSHAGETKRLSDIVPVTFTYQSKRVIGYTGFVESDDVLNQDWQIDKPVYENEQITNWATIEAQLKQKCEAIYGTEASDNLKDPNNAINKFIAYHFMDGKIVMEDRSAVHHWNEYDYACGDSYAVKSSTNYTVNVWDYYTMMSGSLIKITQTTDGQYYINRISEYNTDWVGTNQGNYREKGVVALYDNKPGLNINVSNKNTVTGEDGTETTYNNDGANGYYFPINHVLVNSDDTKNALSSERMRIDFTTIFPEFLSNDLRGSKAAYFPQGYFSNLTNESTDTKVYYMQEGFNGARFGWKDYQGDEFAVSGQYDFVIKLPRVPKDGTYELRLGISNNAERGMVQIYLGTTPDRMNPLGLPIDQREITTDIPGQPWVDDETAKYDRTTCLENDRNLRNQGYMKGPQYFHINGNNKDGKPVRNIAGADRSDAAALRRILTAQTFKADQDYYLRFKLAVPDWATSRLFLDYLEFVPSSIYNGTTPEDIW